jgi:hypothetical protein
LGASIAQSRGCARAIARKSSIARFVRQTRTMTYEKSAAAKFFSRGFPLEIDGFAGMPRAPVRQTRTRFVCCRDVVFFGK